MYLGIGIGIAIGLGIGIGIDIGIGSGIGSGVGLGICIVTGIGIVFWYWYRFLEAPGGLWESSGMTQEVLRHSAHRKVLLYIVNIMILAKCVEAYELLCVLFLD